MVTRQVFAATPPKNESLTGDSFWDSGVGGCTLTTLERRGSASLKVISCQSENLGLLHRKFLSLRPGPWCDAVWAGYFSLREARDLRVCLVRDLGLLLHVGVAQ